MGTSGNSSIFQFILGTYTDILCIALVSFTSMPEILSSPCILPPCVVSRGSFLCRAHQYLQISDLLAAKQSETNTDGLLILVCAYISVLWIFMVRTH